MKAMILAAGYGNRMRPLTDNKPKPLLEIAGKPMIVYHIESLVEAGIVDIIINHSYLGDQIEAVLGDGSQFGAQITFSPEDEPLETAGGIFNALPILGEDPFIVCNGDIWTDYPFSHLVDYATNHQIKQAHLVMVGNPEHHKEGDFLLGSDGLIRANQFDGQQYSNDAKYLTYAGISLIHPRFFAGYARHSFALLEPLLKAIAISQVTGELFTGTWIDIGTPQRLQQLELQLGSL